MLVFACVWHIRCMVMRYLPLGDIPCHCRVFLIVRPYLVIHSLLIVVVFGNHPCNLFFVGSCCKNCFDILMVCFDFDWDTMFVRMDLPVVIVNIVYSDLRVFCVLHKVVVSLVL